MFGPQHKIPTLAASAMLFTAHVCAAPGTPWNWTTDAVAGDFDTKEQALNEVRDLGGKYALAEDPESPTNITDTLSSFPYSAKDRGPIVPDFNEYSGSGGWYATEAEAIESIRAASTYAPHCPATVVTPTTAWSGWTYWYSGDTTQEIRHYRVDFYPNSPTCSLASVNTQSWRKRTVECPAFLVWNHSRGACELKYIAVLYGPTETHQCPIGNPCDVSTGNKIQTETDFRLPWITLSRTYQSQMVVAFGGFGPQWTHNFNIQLSKSGTTYRGIVGAKGQLLPIIANQLLDGSGEQVEQVAGTDQWKRSDGSSVTFTATRFTRQDLPDGQWYTFGYDSLSRLSTVSHSSGRSITFVYDSGGLSVRNRIVQITSSGNVLVSYAYDAAGNLEEVTYADGTTRQYHYENAGFPHHLTGITDCAANHLLRDVMMA